MATYVPAKVSTAYIFYAALVSQANTKLNQVNPTIASGDFKVSIDGGALANLGTLPAVTPAGSTMVKFTLSTTEMAGANATVVCIDAAGAEWCDAVFNIQTAASQIDDIYARLGAPAGASMAADVAAVKAVLPAALTANSLMKVDVLRIDGVVVAGDGSGTPWGP